MNHMHAVHEHNHTRILVSEVLCSLGGQETQNVPVTAMICAQIFWNADHSTVTLVTCGLFMSLMFVRVLIH